MPFSTTPATSSPEATARELVDQLEQLQVQDWLAIGRILVDSPAQLVVRCTSRAILHATITALRLQIAAWLVRDAVETASYAICRSAESLGPTGPRCIAAAVAAAEDAALALLARAYLNQADFDALRLPDLLT